MYLTGLLQAFGVAALMSLYNVYIKVSINLFDIKPLIFPGVYLLVTAGVMLLLSGPGRFMISSIKRPATWIYGFALIGVFVTDIFLTKYVSGTELAILTRVAVPVSMILAFVILKRRLHISDFLSAAIIITSISLVLATQNQDILKYIIIGCILGGIFEAINFFCTEVHKDSQEAHVSGDIRDRARVVSFVTFLTSMIFIILSYITAEANELLNLNEMLGLNILPVVNDIFHLPTIISAAIFGCFVSPFIRYFQWSASLKVNTETVLTILALCPIMTLALEYPASFVDYFELKQTSFAEGSLNIILITLFMTAGAALAAYIKSYSKFKEAKGRTFWEKVKNSSKVESENLAIGFSANNMADYEVVKNTIDFYEGDVEKAADMLELPIDTVKTLAMSKNTYTLREDISKKVHEIFRNKIFYLDQLTGVENKKGLIRQFSEYQNNNIKFNLYYMDINKFKSINDTYGHNVGDVVIIDTINRINDYAKENDGQAFRLGGDEFAMITTTKKDENKVIKEIKLIVNKPINYNIDNKSGTIEPSISIGKANIIKDSEVKIKELIESADENMYKDKNSK
jgi:diguanylate cyclase (GGDEF)-like protein